MNLAPSALGYEPSARWLVFSDFFLSDHSQPCSRFSLSVSDSHSFRLFPPPPSPLSLSLSLSLSLTHTSSHTSFYCSSLCAENLKLNVVENEFYHHLTSKLRSLQDRYLVYSIDKNQFPPSYMSKLSRRA